MDQLMQQIYAEVGREMAEVSSIISESVANKEPFLSEVAGHFLTSSGKKLRPALVLLAGKCCQGGRKRLVRLAAALELIHMASLVHDDVIDLAILRRGRSTTNAKWGNHVAVLLGDYFYARALELAAPLGPKVNKGLGEIVRSLVEGEFRQLHNKSAVIITELDYFNIISNKTAKFVSLCCRLGAEMGRSSPEMVHGLARFGYYTGMAYQIRDDIADILEDAGSTGQECSQDLRTGVITLPVIHALHNGPDREELRALLAKDRITVKDIHDIIRRVCRSGSIDYSVERAREFVREARKSLEVLPEGRAKEALGLLAESIDTNVS